MSIELKATILGNELILVVDEGHRPVEVNRLGSIKIIFPDLGVGTVRVFGLLNDQVEDYENRVEFEKLLRQECEKPEVLKALFSYTGDKPHSKRFNPSQVLADKGWRNRNAEHQRSHHAAH